MSYALMQAWGFYPRDAAAALAVLEMEGVIYRARVHSIADHFCTWYGITPAARRAGMTSARVWRSFDESEARPRRRQSIAEFPPDVRAALGRFTFSYDGGRAYDALKSMGPEAAAKAWRNSSLRMMPSGNGIKPDWMRSKKHGRMYSRRPAVQSLPKSMRTPDIMGNGERVFEVDVIAEHAQICRVLHGMEPEPYLWDIMAEKADTNRDACKEIVNPALGGQSYAGHLKKHSERSLDEYQRVIEAARDLGISAAVADGLEYLRPDETVPVHYLMRLGSRILELALGEYASGPCPGMVLPVHDALWVTGTQADALEAQARLERAAAAVIGCPLPVRIREKTAYYSNVPSDIGP